MSHIKTLVPLSTLLASVSTDTGASCAVAVAYDPKRWTSPFFHQSLGLEARVLPEPLRNSRDGRKFARIAESWKHARSRIFQAEPDVALDVARQTSDHFFNRNTHKPKINLLHQREDLFDPGTKLNWAFAQVSRALFEVTVDGDDHDMGRVSRIAEDLFEFHADHSGVLDFRFDPIIAMGRCLSSLAAVFAENA